MQLLKQYFDLETQIHEYFGYQPNWVDIPLSDETESYWFVTGTGHGAKCVWSENLFTKDALKDGAHCEGPIYTQRFLETWVYRRPDYTMVAVDTQCDGNKSLMIFDNLKELKDQDVLDFYNKHC